MSVWDEIASALKGQQPDVVKRFAVVTSTPLTLSQVDGDEEIDADDDDVTISDNFRQYVRNYPLQPGDIAIGLEGTDGWTLLDVESDRDVVDLKPDTSGAAGARQVFVQATPATPWVIDYKGLPPNVTPVVNGERVGADVEYRTTEDRVLIHFYAPTAGVAYLS